MARKTIAVDDVIEIANTALAVVVDEPRVEGVNRRWGIIGMTEAVLFAADRYRGFRYLSSEFTEHGTLNPGHDVTRRAYFAA